MRPFLLGLAMTLAGFGADAQEGAMPTSGAGEADYAALVDRAVDGYIVPAYGALAASTATLAAETAAYCKDPITRPAVVAAFEAVHEDWAGVDFLRFGPMADRGRLERFYFWPDPRGIGERQMRQMLAARDPALLDPERLAEQSAAVQGLVAFERLVFDPERLIEGGDDDAHYRCAFAGAVAENLHTIAEEALAGWGGEAGWGALMRHPGGEPPVYLDAAEAANELLKALMTGIEQLKDQRMAVPLGATPEEARVARAPFNRSGLTLDYWRASVHALDAFASEADFAKLVNSDRTRWIAGSAAFETRQIERTLDRLGENLEAALTEPENRDRLTYVMTALASLRTTYGVTLAAAAGLSPGFNALDGD